MSTGAGLEQTDGGSEYTIVCSACGEEKDESEFNARKGAKSGHQSSCRKCQAKYNKKYYKKNKKRIIKRTLEYKEKQCKLKMAHVFNVLSSTQCACGYSDIRALQFDHVNPDEKVASIADMVSGKYNWVSLAALKKEIAKCVVRCANCHSIKTSNDRDYWKNALLDVA